MILRYLTFKKKKFIAILSISFIICFSTNVLSQPSFPDKTIILGIRTISAPVTGYCKAFGHTLQREINEGITITSVEILNQYKGKDYSRYFGLLKDRFDPDHVDIECGPNSESSGNLTNPKTGKPFSEDVRFIKFHYPTGIKLLLKQEDAERLANASSSIEYEQEIRNLKIGVLERTSTLKQFEDNKNFYNYLLIDSNDDRNALERVLSALDNNGYFDDSSKIDAFGSDDLILQSLLKEGINESGNKGTKLYVGSRAPYEKFGYVVFPSKNYPSINQNDFYLPRLNSENYAIAIKRGSPNESWLSEKIENSLNTSKSKLNRAKKNLINPYPEISKIGIKPPIKPSSGGFDNKWWMPILIASIPVIGSIVVAILKPEFLILIGNWIIGKRRDRDNTVSVSINGRVLDDTTGETISGAIVSLETTGTPLVESTDGEGIFEFNCNVSNGRIRLRVRREGYQSYERRINIFNIQDVIQIRLSKQVSSGRTIS